MVNKKSPAEKLAEIQELALNLNNRLVDEFGQKTFEENGCLFLGKSYAESHIIYFGLNPGSTGGPQTFDVSLDKKEGSNRPFRCTEKARRDIGYFRNWHNFLQQYPQLETWLNDRVTSTFLVPWRSANMAKLAKLNVQTNGKLYAYSGQLLSNMVQHHDAELFIVAGKRGLHLLNEIWVGEHWHPADLERPFEGPGGTYQWRERTLPVRTITVLQVPHFSRARNLDKLKPFADWLTQKLRPFVARRAERAGV